MFCCDFLPTHPLPETAWKKPTPKLVTNAANFLVVTSRNTEHMQFIAAWLSIYKKKKTAFASHVKLTEHLSGLICFSVPRRVKFKMKKKAHWTLISLSSIPSIQLLITHPSLSSTFGTNSCSEKGKYFQGSNLQRLLRNSVRHCKREPGAATWANALLTRLE